MVYMWTRPQIRCGTQLRFLFLSLMSSGRLAKWAEFAKKCGGFGLRERTDQL